MVSLVWGQHLLYLFPEDELLPIVISTEEKLGAKASLCQDGHPVMDNISNGWILFFYFYACNCF